MNTDVSLQNEPVFQGEHIYEAILKGGPVTRAAIKELPDDIRHREYKLQGYLHVYSYCIPADSDVPAYFLAALPNELYVTHRHSDNFDWCMMVVHVEPSAAMKKANVPAASTKDLE